MEREYIAVIQAGGKGTRMRELTHDKIPKPLLALNRKPIIEWQIGSLSKYGINEFVIITGHLGSLIQDYFNDGTKWGVHISYVNEKEPLGSAGALYYVKEAIRKRDVILIFGDIVFELDWGRYIDFHELHRGIVTLLAHPNAHPYDSDLLIVDRESKVTGIDSKNNIRSYNYKNCVNAGISIFRNELLEKLTDVQRTDYESDLVRPLINDRLVYAYNTPEYVKDVGTPERFRAACKEQVAGVWQAKSLSNQQKAIFIDRDGTINVLNGFLNDEKNFELIIEAADAIKRINSSEYLTIVVTNQPVITRDECSFEELERIQSKLETELGKKGAFINDLFFCPYYLHKGYNGEIPELKFTCKCRKTQMRMLIQAAEKYNIDLSESWYVGDDIMDIQTGINAGMKTVLVKNGEASKDGKYNAVPTLVANDLLEAVNLILG